MAENADYILKCVVLGDAKVGKSSLLRAIKGERGNQSSSDQDLLSDEMLVVVGGKNVLVEFWNSSGMEKHASLRTVGHKGTDIFLICYSVNNRQSYDNAIREWYPEACRYGGPDVPIIVLANKVDLRRDAGKGDRSYVSESEGKSLATSIGAVGFFEVSAQTLYGIQEGFEPAVRKALLRRDKRPARRAANKKYSFQSGPWNVSKRKVRNSSKRTSVNRGKRTSVERSKEENPAKSGETATQSKRHSTANKMVKDKGAQGYVPHDISSEI